MGTVNNHNIADIVIASIYRYHKKVDNTDDDALREILPILTLK